jgi:iron complex transport system substrate-binding protein
MHSELLHDARGQGFTPPGPGPLRLVSLVPSTTETLFALGRGPDLVGYTRFCVRPEGEIDPRKWIGGTKNPKVDRIIALAPNLVLANREENRAEDIAALEAAGIPVWVAEPRTVREAIDDLRLVAALVGRRAEGEQVAAGLETRLAALREGKEDHPRRVAYLIWREPWMVAGQETFIADLLAQGGAVVPFAGRYPEVTLDKLKETDLVLLSSEPFPFQEKHREELLAAGLSPHQVRLVDGERLSWHGVRLLDELPYVAEVMSVDGPCTGQGTVNWDGHRRAGA